MPCLSSNPILPVEKFLANFNNYFPSYLWVSLPETAGAARGTTPNQQPQQVRKARMVHHEVHETGQQGGHSMHVAKLHVGPFTLSTSN